jgi:branched-chain amino acid transport system permease protein
VMSEPATLAIFEGVKYLGLEWFDWQAPGDFDSRALQMRVFVIGLTITLVLRFAPKGLLPEKINKH